jgi:hypothetical protein
MCLWMCIKITTRTLPFVSLQMLELISSLTSLGSAAECNPSIQVRPPIRVKRRIKPLFQKNQNICKHFLLQNLH